MTRTPSDLLAGLGPERAAHSRQVARTVAAIAPHHCHIDQVGDLVTAALLHDIGYHPDLARTGFHPLDGAAYLAEHHHPLPVCYLVATHTAAHLEAQARGIPTTAFTPYLPHDPETYETARAVLTYADLTTSHRGQPCTVQDRLAGILARYDTGPVRDYVQAHHAELAHAGTTPLGLLDDQAATLRHTPGH